MTDAIQSDVLKNEEGETVGTPNPRNAMIDQIAARNLENMQNELRDSGYPVNDEPEPTEVKPETPAHTIVDESQLTQMMVKTKINGVEAEIPLAEVVKSYQKDSAASKRLEEAALQKQALERRAQELDERERLLNTLQATGTQQAQPSDMDATLDEVVNAIYEGDESKTKESLRNLVNSAGRTNATQQAEPLNVNDIASQVQTQIEMQTAIKQFGVDFKDVVADPMLRNLADAYLDDELQTGGKSFAEALKGAGEKTRQWVQQQAAAMGMKSAPERTTDDKQSFKENLDNVRSAKTRVSGDKNEQVPSASSVIAEMRKARGQPV